jgi:hypothetical protein
MIDRTDVYTVAESESSIRDRHVTGARRFRQRGAIADRLDRLALVRAIVLFRVSRSWQH